MGAEPFDMAPDAARAAALDARMRQRLGASLEHIAEAARGRLEFDEAALATFLRRLATAAVPARICAAYFDLVIAIEAGRLDEAAGLLAEISASPNRPADMVVSSLADPAADPIAQRYLRFMDTDPDVSLTLLPPPAEAAVACRGRIAAALALLDLGDPAMAAEIRTLVGDVVLAVGPDDPGALEFDGVSAFPLWGAIMLNAGPPRSVLATAQALAHESGHNLLFGLCADGPLVENDGVPRYRSPLREELRPMDGIVHATFVTARMHGTLARLLASGALDADQAEEARADMASHAAGLAAGLQEVERHALLTDLGRSVMDAARGALQL
jgi:HEXXH motif-containing protein